MYLSQIPEHVHQGLVPRVPGVPVHVTRRPPGGGVQHRRLWPHPVLPRSQDRGRGQLRRQEVSIKRLQDCVLVLL